MAAGDVYDYMQVDFVILSIPHEQKSISGMKSIWAKEFRVGVVNVTWHTSVTTAVLGIQWYIITMSYSLFHWQSLKIDPSVLPFIVSRVLLEWVH